MEKHLPLIKSIEAKNAEDLAICQRYLARFSISFDIHEIQSPCRESELVFIRALIVFILRQKGYSLARIGKILKRNHTTIMHLEKYLDKKHRSDKRFAAIKMDLLNSVFEADILKRIDYHRSEIERLKSQLKTAV